MTIAKLQLIRRLLLQLVAMIDTELRERGAKVNTQNHQQPR
jgi:hypothetical protein